MTKGCPGTKGEGRSFATVDDVLLALEAKEVETLTPIRLRYTGEVLDLTNAYDDQDLLHTESTNYDRQYLNTTVGRVILNDALPKGMPYINGLLKKKGIGQLVNFAYLRFGLETTVKMLDGIKQLGFTYATRAGLSIGIDDMVIPEDKYTLVRDAEKQVINVQQQYLDGAITNGERYNKVIEIWSAITEKVADEMFDVLKQQDKAGAINPIYVMADSGARGSKQQIRQLSGMRGLMAKPSGEIIETPITANFREGLNVLQYFISTHGARKGLADTALKTADSGYLTRRLVDVAQDVIISEDDCGTLRGISASAIVEGGEEIESLRDRIVGRTALEEVVDPIEGNPIVEANQEIDEDLSSEIQRSGVQRVRIRSVLTCESRRGCCIKCYGRNLATGRPVEIGEAVGVIAAQSIGEPGTQLTMRTFHIGGTARLEESSKHEARQDGTIKYLELQTVKSRKGERIAMNRNGSLIIIDDRGREAARYQIVYGAHILVEDGSRVSQDQLLATWDPFTFAILTEVAGHVKFQDLKEGVTFDEEVDEVTGQSRMVVKDSPDEKKQPRLEIRSGSNKVLKTYQMPVRANLMVTDGEEVEPGDIIAKIPRETRSEEHTSELQSPVHLV